MSSPDFQVGEEVTHGDSDVVTDRKMCGERVPPEEHDQTQLNNRNYPRDRHLSAIPDLIARVKQQRQGTQLNWKCSTADYYRLNESSSENVLGDTSSGLETSDPMKSEPKTPMKRTVTWTLIWAYIESM